MPEGYRLEFDQLAKDHDKNYKHCLVKVFPKVKPAALPTPCRTMSGQEQVTTTVLPDDDDPDEPGAPGPTEDREWDSVEKYKEQGPMLYEGPSEIKSVSILCAEGSIVLLNQTEQDIIVPKRQQLGGFGTGEAVQEVTDEGVECVLYDFPQGDKTLVQLEEEGTKVVKTMTFYEMLRAVEAGGNLVKQVTFASFSRPKGDAGIDKVEVKAKPNHKFKIVADIKSKTLCGKNVGRLFHKTIETGKGVKGYIAVAFRFRYEKVGKNLKVQKPYMVTKKASPFGFG
jgi:hypothetical protein